MNSSGKKYEFEEPEINESSKYKMYDPLSEEKPKDQMKPLDLDLMVFLSQREKSRSVLTRELIVVYIPFLIFITMYMFFGFEITTGYWMHEAMKNANLGQELPTGVDSDNLIFKDYNDINSQEELWSYTIDNVLGQLWVEEDYNGNILPKKKQTYLQDSNKQIGALRIRQIRVSNTSCPRVARLSPNLPNFDTSCYAAYTSDTRTKEPFGPNNTWTYGGCESIGQGGPYKGRGGATSQGYQSGGDIPCEGYAVFIPFSDSGEEAIKKVTFLKENNFVDKQTRAFLIEWWSYNSNLNYFSSNKFVIEWTRGGGAIPTLEIKSLRMNPFRDWSNYIYFFISLLLIPFTLIYCYIFFEEIWYSRKTYGIVKHFIQFDEPPFINPQPIVDITNLVFILLSFLFRFIVITHWAYISFNISNYNQMNYPDKLERILYYIRIDEILVSFAVLFTYFKIIKYFKAYETLNLLLTTIQISLFGLITVLITLFIFLLGFAIAGWGSFGYDIDDYKDIVSSMSVLLRYLLGEYMYEDTYQEHRYYFPFYFVLYVVIGFFILLNMFVGVVASGISEAHKKALPDEINIWGTISNYFQSIKNFLNATFYPPSREQNQYKMILKQGDEELIKRLKLMRNALKVQELQFEDLQEAYKDIQNDDLLQRIYYRFDLDNSGTIDIRELELSQKKNELDVDMQEINPIIIDQNHIDSIQKLKQLELKLLEIKKQLIKIKKEKINQL